MQMTSSIILLFSLFFSPEKIPFFHNLIFWIDQKKVRSLLNRLINLIGGFFFSGFFFHRMPTFPPLRLLSRPLIHLGKSEKYVERENVMENDDDGDNNDNVSEKLIFPSVNKRKIRKPHRRKLDSQSQNGAVNS